MGAGIGMLFSGCFPDLVKNLVLIDGFGPLTREPEESCSVLRKG